MRKDTVNRTPDLETPESKNVGWSLLPRRGSSYCNISILVQRFDPGGSFEEHSHDLEQFFYITRGRIEMTIGGKTRIYCQGEFVSVDRNEMHSGRNVSDGVSELIAVDYWPADSRDRIGLE
jgi:quercetin dioxygenase-like cupin family protein